MVKLVRISLEYLYRNCPEEVLQRLVDSAAVAGSYIAGRMVVGNYLARQMAKALATKVAASEAYRRLTVKLGVTSGAGGGGWIGAGILLVMLQGIAQRSSKASMRLKARHPQLYSLLRAEKGLDLLYFLVEKPLENHLKTLKQGDFSIELIWVIR